MSFGPPPSIYTQSALAADQEARSGRRTKLLGALAVPVAVGLGTGGWLLSSEGEDSAPAVGKTASAAQSPDEITVTVEKVPDSSEGQPSGISGVFLPSCDPPVLAVAAGDSAATDLISLDAAGKHLATVSSAATTPSAAAVTSYGPSSVWSRTATAGWSAARTRRSWARRTSPPASRRTGSWHFDLRAGKTAGKFDGRELQDVYPLRMSDDDLLICRRGVGTLGPAAVVGWKAKRDKEAPLLLFQLAADDDSELGDPEQTEIVYEKGRVFFGKREIVREDEAPEDPVLSAIDIGSAGLKR